MAGPLPILTPSSPRHAGVALRERLHHHRGVVGGSPVGGRGKAKPRGDGPVWRPAGGDGFESGPQAAACAIEGRRPRNEGPAQ